MYSIFKTSKLFHKSWTVYKASVNLEVDGKVVSSVTVKFQTFQTLFVFWILPMSENMQISGLDILKLLKSVVYSSILVHAVPRMSSGSTVTLSRLKQLLKMKEWQKWKCILRRVWSKTLQKSLHCTFRPCLSSITQVFLSHLSSNHDFSYESTLILLRIACATHTLIKICHNQFMKILTKELSIQTVTVMMEPS